MRELLEELEKSLEDIPVLVKIQITPVMVNVQLLMTEIVTKIEKLEAKQNG